MTDPETPTPPSSNHEDQIARILDLSLLLAKEYAMGCKNGHDGLKAFEGFDQRFEELSEYVREVVEVAIYKMKQASQYE